MVQVNLYSMVYVGWLNSSIQTQWFKYNQYSIGSREFVSRQFYFQWFKLFYIQWFILIDSIVNTNSMVEVNQYSIGSSEFVSS